MAALRATAQRYEETLRKIQGLVGDAFERCDPDPDLLGTLSDALHEVWCCAEYETGSGQHTDECEER